MSHPKSLALLIAIPLLLAMPAPAGAESVRVKDTYAGQPDHQNIQRGTLSYSSDRVVTYRVKYKNLSTKHTRLCTKFIRPNYVVQACTQWRTGKPAATATIKDRRLPKEGISVKWDFDTDVITLKLDRVEGVKGPEADMLAFSLYPGAQHGHPFGDALYAADLARG